MSTVARATDRLGTATLRSLREIYAELGLALLSNGRYADATAALAKALEEAGTVPASAALLDDLAVAYEHAQHPDLAFKSYLQAVQLAPQHISEILPSVHKLLTAELAETHGDWLEREWQTGMREKELTPQSRAELARLLGRVNLYRHRYKIAAETFQRALDQAPLDPRLWEGLGEAQWYLRELDRAQESLKRAYDLACSEPFTDRLMSINAKLARALEAEGQYEGALARIAESLDKGNRFADELLLIRSRCYLALGRPTEALEAAEAATNRDTRSIDARLLCSQALIAAGRYQDAVNAIEAASQIDPTRVEVRVYKAQALIEGQIDISQGRRLLARYAMHAEIDVLSPDALPAYIVARKTNSNTLFFLAELDRAFGKLEEALKKVEEALQQGIGSDRDYGEAPALQLKGELLEAKGDKEKAAEALFEAGQRFLWRKEYEVAVAQLRHSVDLIPNRPDTHWYLAEALRMLSYGPVLRWEEKSAAIKESASIWKKSFQMGNPKREDFWIYLTGAWINEQCINLFTNNLLQQRLWWWESIGFLERAILLNDQDADAWASLSRSHRCLGNRANSWEASSKAWELDPKNSSVQEERSTILAVLGDLQAADEIIESRRAAGTSAFADNLKAYILAEQRQYKPAIGLLEQSLALEPDDLWTLDLRARCLRLTGNSDDAQREYQRIWSRCDPNDAANQTFFAVAAFHLGYFTEASRILAESPEVNDNNTANFYLGASLLAQSKLQDGERYLAAAVELSKNALEVDDTLVEDLPGLDLLAKNWPHAAEAGKVLDHIRKQAEARKVELHSLPAPEAELATALDKLALAGELEGGEWMGIYAGLGRLHLAAGRCAEAAASYSKLVNYRDRFPELRLATGNVATAFQQEGDRLFKEGQFAESREAFRNGLGILSDDTQDGIMQKASMQLRLAIASLLNSQRDDARSELSEWLPTAREAGSEIPGKLLADVCQELFKKPEHFWTLDEEWADFASRLGQESELARELASARTVLSPLIVGWLELERPDLQFEPRVPVVTPIIMDVGSGLIPSDTSENWSLFKTHIPTMRGWFEQQMGVTVPGVRVRSDDSFGEDGYTLRLDEHFVARGRAYLDMRFFPGSFDHLQALGIPEEDVKQAINPVTNKPGFWIPKQHWESVLFHGLELWDEPLVFVIRHLQAIVQQCLGDFVGIEEVNRLLVSWGKREEDSALIQQVLPDEGAILRFARLLRALVREQVPISDWKEILASVQSPGSGNLDEEVRAARIRLRKQLPGNRADARRLELPQEWKNAIRSWTSQTDGQIIFAPPPAQVHSFVLTIGDLVPFGDSNAALVVDYPPARPHVRQLIAPQFPGLMVLSTEELLPPDNSFTSAA